MPPKRRYAENRTVRLMRPEQYQDAAAQATGPASVGLNMLNRLMAGHQPSRYGTELGLLRNGRDVVRGIFPESGRSHLMAVAVDQYLQAPQDVPFSPPFACTPIEMQEVNRRLHIRAQQHAYGYVRPGAPVRSPQSSGNSPRSVMEPPTSSNRLRKAGFGSRGPYKYIKRERKGNRWVYTYPDDKQPGDKANSSAPDKSEEKADAETYEQRVRAVDQWTNKNVEDKLDLFHQETGISLTVQVGHPSKVLGVVKDTAKQVLRVNEVIKGIPHAEKLQVEVCDHLMTSAVANAEYLYSHNQININSKTGRHSLIHELGHFIDHGLGDLNNTDDLTGYLSALSAEQIRNNPRAHAMFNFLSAAEKSGSAKEWRAHTVGKKQFRQYLFRPEEIFARFFDFWVHSKSVAKGLPEVDYDAEPLERYGMSSGAFSDADVKKLTPLFEKLLGQKMVKSLLELFKAAYIPMGTPESKAAWRRASRICAEHGHTEPAYVAHVWRALTGRDASISAKTLKRWAYNRKRRKDRKDRKEAKAKAHKSKGVETSTCACCGDTYTPAFS